MKKLLSVIVMLFLITTLSTSLIASSTSVEQAEQLVDSSESSNEESVGNSTKAGQYYPPASSMTESYIQLDDISTEADESMYNSTSVNSLVISDMSNVSRVAGNNLVRESDRWHTDFMSGYDTTNPDIFKYENALKDVYGRDYDLYVKIIDIELLPFVTLGTNTTSFAVYDDGHYYHQNLEITTEFSVTKPGSETKLNQNMTFLFEDMDYATEIGFEESQIDRLIIPTSSRRSTDYQDPANYFNWNDHDATRYVGLKWPSNADVAMKNERLRAYRDGASIVVVDSWYTGLQYDTAISLDPESIMGTEGFYNLQKVFSTGTIYNMQNSPEQNFAVEIQTPTEIIIGQDNNFRNAGSGGNNLYFNSPEFAPYENDNMIEKSATETDDDGIIEAGDTVEYSLKVTDLDAAIASINVPVRDSLVEKIASGTITYADYNYDLQVYANDHTTLLVNGTDYTGDLISGDLVIFDIPSEENVYVDFSVTLNSVPNDVGELINVATDNGLDPDGLCDSITATKDCDGVELDLKPQTTITKELITESIANDGIVEGGEAVTYRLTITNPNIVVDALEVPVRDSLLENLPGYLDYDSTSLVVNGSSYSGDLTSGDFILDNVAAGTSVTIDYTLTISDPIPSDIANVVNVVTDNGDNPDGLCNSITADEIDCDGVEIPVTPDTTIKKQVINESIDTDGVAELGETLTYQVEVINDSEVVDATDIPVRDSVIEAVSAGAMPWLSFDESSVRVDGAVVDSTIATGSLTDGTFVLNSIIANGSALITYNLTVIGPIPDDIDQILNIVTDNGQNPEIIDPDTCDGIHIGPITIGDGSGDCALTITPLEPVDPIIDPVEAETVISKSVTDDSGDNLIQGGEVLTYTIEVTNPETIAAHDVVVRDSMLESTPSWLTFNDDVTINPSDIAYSGSLTGDGIKFDVIEAGQTVTITYSVTASQPLPAGITEVANLATDNGSDPVDPGTGLPAICPAELVGKDCSETVTTLDPMDPIIDPGEAETVISKSVIDESGDNLVQGGEVLTYTIEVTNPETIAAHDVIVRDSMLESMPTWLTFNDDITIDPTDIAYNGSLQTGDLTFTTIEAGQTVTITYSVTASQPLPADITEVANLATDNGSDPVDPDTGLPAICPAELVGKDCSETVTPLDPMDPIIDPGEAETVITKSVLDDSGDNLVQGGEVLTYTIEVTNPETIAAHDVVVRDSMLESMPSWLTFNDDVTIDPTDIAYSGSLQTGDLTFNTIEAGQTVTITYSVTASQPLPADITEVANLATDNGSDPVDPDTGLPAICPAELVGKDCSETVTPLDPMDPIIDPGEAETVISKSVIDESGDNLVQGGEVLTYTIEVTNPETIVAHDVVVRDSMLESMPSWLTFNDDITIDPTDIAYSGSLQTGDLTFTTIEAGQTVTITYSVTASQPLPADITEVANLATDNGSDPVDPDTGLPVICPAELVGKDCSETVTPLDPMDPIIDPGEAETVITKSVLDDSRDNLVQGGEVLTYTIEVTNPETIAAHNVVVRDSMLEAMPSWLTLNDDVTIDPTDIAYSGSLQTGDLTFNTIEAGQTVTITYSVTASQPLPVDITEVANLATDNGSDPVDPDTGLPVICPAELVGKDCSETVTPLDPMDPIIDPGEAETVITKSVADASGDNQVQGGEALTYTIEVTNPETITAHDVVVRDSMLESIPSWLTFNDDVTINPTDIAYSGSLQTGDLTFNTIEAGQTVTITYSMTASQPLPADITEVANLATNNGQDPTVVDPDTCDGIHIGPITIGSGSDDCAITVTPLDPMEPIIDPGEAETVITKSISDASGDNLVQGGEVLTYTIEVTNPETITAHDVVVRDSMLESMPSWLTFNDDVTIDPTDIAYSGSLQTGDLTFNTIEAGKTVTITYSMTASQPLPADITEVANLATDNGQDPTTVDPDTCDGIHIGPITIGSDDCAITVTPLDPMEPIIDPGEAETVITKSISDASEDNLVQGGEVLTYTLEVTNLETIDAHNVVVRDSMLENIPSWLEFNDDVVIDPTDIKYSGDLTTDGITFDVIEAGQTVTITYSMTASQPLPADISEVTNIATDNGQDPTTIDPEVCTEQPEDCDQVTIPLDPMEPIIDPTQAQTVITKSVADASEDNLVQGGEVLTYTLEVTNPETIDAHNVVVRDSMLESIPSWLEFNDDVVIDPTDIAYSGDLTTDGITFDVIEAGQTVTITYSVTASQPLPVDISEVTNIATDNGQDPTTIDPEVCTAQPEDCDQVTIPLDPMRPIIDPSEAETVITKSVADASEDNLIQGGEVLTYTLEVTNDESIDAHNVVVRDSMLENIPSWLEFNDDVVIDPTDIKYSGDLTTDGITFDVIEAGQTVTITYSMTASQPLPADISEVTNIATDNGQDPTTIDPEVCTEQPEDCDQVTIPLDPIEPIIDPTQAQTVITKSVVDASEDNLVQGGEVLTYTLEVTNSETVDAHNVVVRDSMLENIPSWLEFNDDVVIDPTDITYSGNLTTDGITFDVIEAGQTVTITYSMTASQPLPVDISEVTNIATDNGQDPTTIDPEVCTTQPEDCDQVTIPLDPMEPIIDPTQAQTVITKSVADASEDNLVQGGEALTYALEVTNNESIDAHNVVVRDSMLENIPSWLEFNDDVVIDPTDIKYSGDLTTDGITFDVIEAGQTVTITYSVTASQPLPADISEVINIATDNGQDPTTIDPEVCTEQPEDCDQVTIPLDPSEPIIDPSEAETVITKSVADASEDNLVQGGEVLTYTLEVTNNESIDAHNVVVRDSMLENIPSWLEFNDDVVIDPTDIKYSGDLTTDGITFDVIEAGQTVTITYSVTASQPLPADISEVTNIATDNGQDPTTIDPEVCTEQTEDCDQVTIPLDPSEPIIDPSEAETVISKSVNDESGNGILEANEILTYTIEVTNPETVDAHNVVVRDSMLENIPSWLEFNDDVVINPTDIKYSGDLTTDGITFDVIEAGQTVTITYSVTSADELPLDISDIPNVATDNGENPVDPDTELPIVCSENSEDCSATITPLEGDTTIEKVVSDGNGDGILQSGETLIYTVAVTNPGVNAAHNVIVRDSLIENTPEWLTFNDDVVIDPSDIASSGSLALGDLSFDVIEPAQTVTITYSLVASDPLLAEVENVTNIATDNGLDPNVIDPEVCQNNSEDCALTVTPTEPTEGSTEITKRVSDEDGNGIISGGETLTYTLSISNNSDADAHNVIVRDSMIEETPEWLTFNKDVTINPADIKYSGNLASGDLSFDVIEVGQEVEITYSLTADDVLPVDISSISNIATDNGQDPITIDPEECSNQAEDCDQVTVQLAGDTRISKSVIDENENGVLEANETLTYTIEILNYTDRPAFDVVVRDSMLEETPKWLVFNSDLTIDPSNIEYTGSLPTGDMTIGMIEAGQSVVISYTMTAASELPSKVTEATNIATDNGQDPTKISPEVCEENDQDCSSATVQVEEQENKISHLATTGGKTIILLLNLIAITLITLSLKIRLSK